MGPAAAVRAALNRLSTPRVVFDNVRLDVELRGMGGRSQHGPKRRVFCANSTRHGAGTSLDGRGIAIANSAARILSE
jgi:hypothetical protein